MGFIPHADVRRALACPVLVAGEPPEPVCKHVFIVKDAIGHGARVVACQDCPRVWGEFPLTPPEISK